MVHIIDVFSADIADADQKANPKEPPRLLLTLRPHLFTEMKQQAYDISDLLVAKFMSSFPYFYKTITLRTDLTYHPQQHFPTNTKGYLYYHRLEGNKPPFIGEVRWRVCDDHTAFDDGYDLPHHRYGSEPWSLSLLQIASTNHVAGIRHMLAQEKMVEYEVLADLAKLPVDPLATVLSDVEQPFLVDLADSGEHPMALVSRKSCMGFSLGPAFVDERVDGKVRTPYTGEC